MMRERRPVDQMGMPDINHKLVIQRAKQRMCMRAVVLLRQRSVSAHSQQRPNHGGHDN